MIFASASASANSGLLGTGSMILWMVVLFGLMYFLMIRPQKKEQKRMSAMLSELAVGDAIVTSGGFYGIVIDVMEEDVIVEFGNNKNCRIPMRKAAIAEVEKPEQAAKAGAAAQKEESTNANDGKKN